uniref:Synaptogyrin-2 n=1 Tax=Schistocephalus solidus TaxID=70667 RepID=A0A0X3PLJ1_SCHSO
MEVKGYRIEPRELIKSPIFALRIICLIFCVIILACLNRDGYYLGQCVFYGGGSACSFGLGMGSIGLILSLAFMLVDAIFNGIGPQTNRKIIASVDTGIAAFVTLTFFVGFCYLTNHWQRADPTPDALATLNLNNIRAAIAFMFFSIFSWGGLTYAAYMRYRATVQYGVYADDVIRPGGGGGGAGSGGVMGGDHGGYHDPTSYPDTFEAPPYDSSGKYFDESQFVSGRNANDTDILAS